MRLGLLTEKVTHTTHSLTSPSSSSKYESMVPQMPGICQGLSKALAKGPCRAAAVAAVSPTPFFHFRPRVQGKGPACFKVQRKRPGNKVYDEDQMPLKAQRRGWGTAATSECEGSRSNQGRLPEIDGF